MPLIGITEAAALAQTTRTRVYNAIKRGDLTPAPDLPVLLLDPEQVTRWGQNSPSKGGRPRKPKEVNTDAD